MRHGMTGQIEHFTSQVVDAIQMLLLSNKTEGIAGCKGNAAKVTGLSNAEHIFQCTI